MRSSFILFDFDGTLVDTVADIAHHANTVLKRRGIEEARSIQQVRDGIGWGVHELLKSLTPSEFWENHNLDGAVEEFKSLYAKEPVLNSRPYPGVQEVLGGALTNVPKAILTNKPHRLTVSILEKLELMRHFDAVLGDGAGYPKKPDPAGAHYLMGRWKTSPDRCVLVGDSQVDLDTARNAGMRFAWVDYGYDTRPINTPELLRFSTPLEWVHLCAV